MLPESIKIICGEGPSVVGGELNFLNFLSLLLCVLGVPLTHALGSVGASLAAASLLFLGRRGGLVFLVLVPL